MSETNEARPDFGQWPRMLGVEELAAYLGIAVQTVRNHAAKGDIPGKRRLGRRCVFDRKRIDVWLDEGDEFRDLWVDGARRGR